MSLSSLPAGPNGNDMLSVRPGKWTLVVIAELRQGRMRFGELRRAMGGVSQKSLTTTLRELERDGFISRRAYATIPPHVDYRLTALGLELLDLADGWRQFAMRNRDAVEAARLRFDRDQQDFAITLPQNE